MSLNDVWRDISNEIGVYWRGRFDRVPMAPGIYAWFYPLRLTTYNLNEFIREVNSIQCFDARLRGEPIRELAATFTWESIGLRVQCRPRQPNIKERIQGIWENCTSNPDLFARLQRNVMRSSIFMPPLYVGKAQDLNIRCGQHRNGTGANAFHTRYEGFAHSLNVQAKTVNDLLFACIVTTEDRRDDREGLPGDMMEEVVEEIVKYVCKPVYSVR